MPIFRARTNFEEVDGSPSVYPYKLKVTNGSLADNGDGTATLTVSAGTVTTIPEYLTDPATPSAEDVWVLNEGARTLDEGSPMGLLLSLTYAASGSVGGTYRLSYRTAAGTTVRTTLT